MITALTAAAVVSATLAIAADWEERRSAAFYLAKPLTTLLILGIAALAPPSAYQHWLLVALALSLAGDICLLFPSDRWFVAGLASFLAAHLAFVAAFLQGVDSFALPAWLAAVAAYGAALFAVLVPRAGRLRLPVLSYGAVLGAMVCAAAARYEARADAGAARALAGALLFMLSDSLLGWRRFVGRYRGAQALILSTYWAAIGLIAGSA